jgi:hypothetical protein
MFYKFQSRLVRDNIPILKLIYFSVTFLQKQNNKLKKKLQLIQSQHLMAHMFSTKHTLVEHDFQTDKALLQIGSEYHFGNDIKMSQSQYTYVTKLDSGKKSDGLFVNALLDSQYSDLRGLTVTGKPKADKSVKQIDPNIYNFIQGVPRSVKIFNLNLNNIFYLLI